MPRLLGAVPERSHISYGRLKMKWLVNRFNTLPVYATDEQVRQYTRAYILQLIGGMIFADKTHSWVHLMYMPLLEYFQWARTYNWGSACLSWFYRPLYRPSSKEATKMHLCDMRKWTECSSPLFVHFRMLKTRKCMMQHTRKCMMQHISHFGHYLHFRVFRTRNL